MTDGLEELGLPPLGHNKPPDDAATKHEELFKVAGTLTGTVNKWLAERPAITDAEMAKAAQLMIDQLRKVRGQLEAALKAEREPIDLALAAVRLMFKVPTDTVQLGLDHMLAKMEAWLKGERERLAQEQLQREREADAAIEQAAILSHEAEKPGASLELQLQARDAEARAAQLTDKATAGPARPHVKGDFARRAMGLTSRWKARIVDPRAALRHYAKHETVRQAALVAVLKLATAEAKACKGQGEPPPGCQFYNDQGVT